MPLWLAVTLAALLLTAPQDGRDPTTFKARVAAFDARDAQLLNPASSEMRGQAALAWLQALEAVLDAIPIERTDNPIFKTWLDAHDALVVYSEPSGQWLIREDVISKLHDDHRDSLAAEEIAWLGATNGLPGECEGYIPCYAFGLNHLEGEYLRRHPTGLHRSEALALIVESLRIVLDDLLRRPDRTDFLTVPRDCADLLASLRPLRQATAATRAASDPPALEMIDRLMGYCPGSG